MSPAEHDDNVVNGVDVDALAQAIGACPAVARLGSGLAGAMTTYLPGRTVPGVRVDVAGIEAEVVARWGYPVAAVADQVRAAAAAVAPVSRIDVTIADVELPDGAGQLL